MTPDDLRRLEQAAQTARAAWTPTNLASGHEARTREQAYADAAYALAPLLADLWDAADAVFPPTGLNADEATDRVVTADQAKPILNALERLRQA